MLTALVVSVTPKDPVNHPSTAAAGRISVSSSAMTSDIRLHYIGEYRAYELTLLFSGFPLHCEGERGRAKGAKI